MNIRPTIYRVACSNAVFLVAFMIVTLGAIGVGYLWGRPDHEPPPVYSTAIHVSELCDRSGGPVTWTAWTDPVSEDQLAVSLPIGSRATSMPSVSVGDGKQVVVYTILVTKPGKVVFFGPVKGENSWWVDAPCVGSGWYPTPGGAT
ncbi:MAG: hypothetical protein ACR2LF_10770 [Jatrophihabitantaceae bacterium]